MLEKSLQALAAAMATANTVALALIHHKRQAARLSASGSNSIETKKMHTDKIRMLQRLQNDLIPHIRFWKYLPFHLVLFQTHKTFLS